MKNNKLLNAVLENITNTFHEPDGILKHPYLDPGGVYSKNLWDWDSFWTFKGLIGIADKISDDELKKQALKYGTGAVNNFFEYQGEDGSLPILMNDNDPDCFDCHQSNDKNMAKPVFGQFCNMIAENSDTLSDELIDKWCSALDKFYNCYESRYFHDETGLYVWANDVAIGVDDDPSTWGRPPFSSANIFLNCFLYADLKAAANFAGGVSSVGKEALATLWNDKAAKLADAIQEFCWDERDGVFYSVDVLCQQNLAEHRIFGELNINLSPFWKVMPLKVMSWVSFLPLWCGIATKEQAERMVNENLINEKRFWAEWGVRSLSADERMYSPSEKRGNPSNWLGPIWIISNYLVWEGLANNEYDEIAQELSEKIHKLLNRDFEKNNLLHENYNPETGEGIAAPGFWNWNILACIME
jgi:putative isomerase